MHSTIREMTAFDAVAVSALLPDLGYEATSDQVRRRFLSLDGKPGHGFFVATLESTVVGWAHVYGVRLIETDGYAEIGGLAVSAERQRKGVGTQLVRRAEQWAEGHGFGRVRLRSGVQREDAHLFYEALGYSRSRASFAFERLALLG